MSDERTSLARTASADVVDVFVRNAAHELRTPVAAIVSAIEVLENGAKEVPDDRDRFLGHIARSAARLDRLVEALVVLAQARGGGSAPGVGRVELRPLLESVAAEIEPETGVSVATRCAPELAAVGTRGLIEQLIGNLAANAAHNTTHGRIDLEARADGDDHVVVEVRDTGSGMSAVRGLVAAHQANGGSPEPNGEPSGIGLAIVGEAVRALDGHVAIETGEHGTVARVVLPRAEPELLA